MGPNPVSVEMEGGSGGRWIPTVMALVAIIIAVFAFPILVPVEELPLVHPPSVSSQSAHSVVVESLFRDCQAVNVAHPIQGYSDVSAEHPSFLVRGEVRILAVKSEGGMVWVWSRDESRAGKHIPSTYINAHDLNVDLAGQVHDRIDLGHACLASL